MLPIAIVKFMWVMSSTEFLAGQADTMPVMLAAKLHRVHPE